MRGETLDFGLKFSYWRNVMNNLKTDQIGLSLGDANSSALITLPEDTNFKYVVMPMRI